MISYELAKKLKDVGFKEPEEDSPYHGTYIPIAGTAEGYVYAPTLEELIEECGDEVVLVKKGNTYTAGQTIEDHPDGHTIEPFPCGEGATPSEAVANLWLKLNEE